MATYYDGTRTTLSDTTAQKRTITDFMSIISPKDVPLIARFGVHKSPPVGWNLVGWPGVKPEWLEDELMPYSGTTGASITSTGTSLTVTDASLYHEGDDILVDSEQMWVSARSTGTNVLTVVRGYGGTTAASHASGATVEILGNARHEAVDSSEGSARAVTNPYNYVQIFHDEVRVGDLERRIQQYGIPDPLEYQVEKKLRELAVKLEKAALFGGRSNVSAGNYPRRMGSLDFYINVSGGNTVSAGGAVTQSHFETAMQNCFDDGGNPTVALISPANIVTVKNFYDSSSYLRVDRDEDTVGMVIQKLETPFGVIDFLVNRWMRDDRIYLIDPKHYSGLLEVAPWEREILARTGTATKVQITGTFTQMVRHGADAHGAIINIS